MHQILNPPCRRPKLGALTVSCPMVVGALGHDLGYAPLPITRMAVEAQCQISMGFVKTTIEAYYPQTWRPSPLQLCAPKTVAAVVSEVVVENLVRDQVYLTAIVPADEATKGGYKPSVAYDPTGAPVTGRPPSDPELFLLPLPGRCQPGDRLRITLTTFEPLTFSDGSYGLRLATEIPPGMVPQGYHLGQLLEVIYTINTGSPTPVKYESRSGHELTVGLQAPGRVTLSAAVGPQAQAGLGT
ncbi:hypothetical protein GPECTOR_219g466 [Gonium pectorale]|uniref:Uncharacterized protein n=1 Tax=Gonium pectorale TaxID=33097 RepID=A0A150FYD1_GONPE|nr:hypothetical protein GPECTOR_219g466 [Gonium pectorale]|eukprot:KXZ42030.1 hypothetical protein GPECTOR_219g466 [Gonium pectorale]